MSLARNDQRQQAGIQMSHRMSRRAASTNAALSIALFGGLALPAQGPAIYEVFGDGCRGNGFGPLACASINPAGGTNTTTALLNEYAYGFRASSAMTVIGFQLFTQTFSKTSDAIMRTGFYRKASKNVEPAANSEVRGEMRVSPKLQFYTSFLATPVSVAKGEVFWVSGYDSRKIRAAGITSGQRPVVPVFFRIRAGDPTARWTLTGIVQHPSVRILCVGKGSKGAVPILTYTGLPRLGKRFSIDLRQAIPGQPATLFVGLSWQKWGALNLPFDLTPVGAPSCRIHVAGQVILGLGNTDANGNARLTVAVPNSGSVVGIPFFNQIWVRDPTNNAMGIAVTNGGVGVAGK